MAEDDEGGWVGLATAGSRLKGSDVNSAQTRKDLMDYKELLREQMESVDPNDPPGWMTTDQFNELQNMYSQLEEYASHFDVDPAHFVAYAANIVCDIVGMLFGALKLTVSNTKQIVSDTVDGFRNSGRNYDETTYSNGVKEKEKRGKRKDKAFEGQGKNSERQENANEYKYSRQARAEQIRSDNDKIARYEERRAKRARLISSLEEEEERQKESEMALKR